jgi:hypothetical protein
MTKKYSIVGGQFCALEPADLPVVAVIWDGMSGGAVTGAKYLGSTSNMADVEKWLSQSGLAITGERPWIGATYEFEGKIYANCVTVKCYEDAESVAEGRA